MSVAIHYEHRLFAEGGFDAEPLLHATHPPRDARAQSEES